MSPSRSSDSPRGPALTAPGGEGDPRQQLDGEALAAASHNAFPIVAQSRKGSDTMGLALGGLGAVLLGGITFMSLSHGRAMPVVETAAPAPAPTAPAAPPPPTFTPVPMPAPLPAASATPPVSAVAIAGAASPALVYDGQVSTTTAPAAPAAKTGDGKEKGKSDDMDDFLAKATSSVDTAVAEKLGNPSNTITQGTLISAVLETALNSDLPGYARALVTQDVRGFDGRKVLIPRYSRLIGQYKSGIATGQKRAYVIWSRLLRPDGVSVQLGSPGVDFGGQAGVTGKVYNHYLERYGSAVVLSVLTGLASTSNNAVVLSTGNSAAAVATQHDGQIPPTIKVPAGSPIRVFLARDLDFSPVDAPGRKP
ncbi:TrbI/VirB10 family protein [Novosphingobium rosa]|uniref:TrbI/VirB10 family protein n=1 Tax=Novosphingobium rosa TaxID=76978 RepID=UPI00082D99D4|nr:TrbI/VirB10 family protein [Novosphingobium rosa]